jgi:predicted transposase YbfD/YdcC
VKTGTVREETAYIITSLSPEQGSPARLMQLNRGQWEIENRSHWVRDVTFDEDRCQIRTGSGPRVMASLRNFAIGLLRLLGHHCIAKAVRHFAARPHRVPVMIGF